MTSDEGKLRRRKGRGKFWVSGVVLLISFIAYTSQLFVIAPTYPRGFDASAERWLICFNLVVLGIFLQYAVCVTTSPGSVPPGWSPPLPEGADDSALRYCRACDAYKPPRAHHCRHCRQCVLRMDHHCPWVNNCVGHRNYAGFLRFLFLVDIGIVMHLYKISECAFGRALYTFEPTNRFMVLLVLNYAASLPVLFAVGIFSFYHLYCLLANSTSIEQFEKEGAARAYRRGHVAIATPYPFSIGPIRNFTAVFGSNPLLWFWPWQQASGDGLSYPLKAGLDPLVQYRWPPKDPFKHATPSKFFSAPPEGIQQYACPPFAEGYDTGRSALDEDDDDDVPLGQLRARRGSEGYEVKTVTGAEREALVRRYAGSRNEELPDRYRRYDPNEEDDGDFDDSD